MKKLAHGSRDIKLVVGGEARVDLLPKEVAARAQAKSTRRALVGVVVTAMVISGIGYSLATMVAAGAASQLESEQARTTALLQEQAKFSEVSQVESRLAATREATAVGASTEVDWRGYIGSVQTVLPEGVAITNLVSDTATPMESYAQSDSPLQGERIATLVFTGRSADLPQVEQWLISLETLPGFVDAVPGSIASDEEAGYSVTITMHINTDAFTGRFAPTDADLTGDGQ